MKRPDQGRVKYGRQGRDINKLHTRFRSRTGGTDLCPFSIFSIVTH